MAITAAQLLVRVGGDTSDADAKLGSLSGKIDGFGQSAMQVGARLSAWVTTPLLGVGAAAVKVGADYDRSMNLLRANTGATAEDMQRLRDQAELLGADLSLPGASAANAADAMLELSKAGLDVNETLNASRGVLELAAAGQLDNARAAEVAANALNAFGLDGKEATRVADLLAAAANKSSGDVTDIADSLKMASAVAASANMPIEDLVTAISMMANAGIKGHDAGTSLKQMLLSLMAPSDKARKLINELGISIYDAQGNMLPMPALIEQFSGALGGLTQEQRNAALATIFGSDAVRAANVVLMGGVDAFSEMKGAVTEAGAAADMAKAQTEGLGGAVGRVKTALSTALLNAVQPFTGDLNDLADTIAETATAFSNLDEGTQKTIVGIGLIAAGAGPATWALGALGRTASTVIAGVGGLVTAGKAFAGAWQAGLTLTTSLEVAFGATAVTVGAVVVAIGALVAVWVQWNEQVVKTNQEGAKAVSDTWTRFFKDQAAAGANATQVVDEYLAAQRSAQDALNDVNPLLRLFIANQDQLTQSYDGLSSAVLASADSYTQYRASLERVAEANGLVIDSEGNLVQIVQDDFGAREELVTANYALSESEYDLAQAQKLVNDAIYEGTNNGLAYSGAANDVGVGLANVEKNAGAAAAALGDVAGATGEAAAAAMEADQILSGLESALADNEWTAGAARQAQDALRIALGQTSQAQVDLENDVRVVTEAFAQGIITQETYSSLMQEAANGTLQLDDAQRQQFQTALQQAEANRLAAEAARELTLRQMELAQSFSSMVTSQQEQYDNAQQRAQEQIAENERRMAEIRQAMNQESDPERLRQYRTELQELAADSQKAAGEMAGLADEMRKATEAQVAQAAIGELGRSLDSGAISFETYVTAVSQVQQTFGLVNDKGVALATGLTALTTALEQGQIPAQNYDDALKAMIQDAEDGTVDIQALLTTFGTAPGAIDPATTSLNGGTQALQQFGEQAKTTQGDAQQASTGIQNAFTTPDWQGIGGSISAGIAQGIRSGIGDIQAAAAEAANAAVNSVNTTAQIASPSRVMYQKGAYMMQGWELGIRENRQRPVREMAAAAQTIIRETPGGNAQHSGAGRPADLGALMQAAAQPRQRMAQPINLAVSVGGEELKRVTLNALAEELA